MKLIVVAHNLIRGDGQGRINFEIVRYALQQGHQVTLIATRTDPELESLGAVWRRVTSRLPHLGLYNVRAFARQTDRLLEKMRGEADCVIGNGYTMSAEHDVNLCQFVHGAWMHSSVHPARTGRGLRAAYQFAYTRFNARWEKRAFNAAKHIVVPSKLAWRELESIGVLAEKIRLIPNAVDLTEFAPGPVNRRELGLPEGVPLALFAGDIKSNRKNLDSVLKAMQQLPSLHLAVVGALDGSPYPAMAEKFGLAERVHFLGFRRDAGRVFRAADLFIFPSRYDTFGLVVLEAMACGLPVVTASTVGAGELMTSDCGSVIADPDDIQALTVAVRKLLDDPAYRARAGVAAREVAEKNGWDQMAKAYFELITA